MEFSRSRTGTRKSRVYPTAYAAEDLHVREDTCERAGDMKLVAKFQPGFGVGTLKRDVGVQEWKVPGPARTLP